jgi:hypothetical protein
MLLRVRMDPQVQGRLVAIAVKAFMQIADCI